MIRDEFEQVIAEFQADVKDEDTEFLTCKVRHVDGTYNARERGERLDWLREATAPEVCRVLTNARCLAEGVDVPALDAVLFLHPRNSQIDVVQSVGRVMRRAPGKRMGYVILPVGVPAGVEPAQALNDNKKYRVVWQILNALRAHDERLDAVINQGGLGQDVSDRIAIVDGRSSAPGTAELRAVTGEIDSLPAHPQARRGHIGKGGATHSASADEQEPLPLTIDEFSYAVMAKIVEKCGTRDYWEDWAKDVARIAERHVTRITTLVEKPGSTAELFFQDFLKELRDDLNKTVSERDAIEMLAQHLITRPVFDALFENDDFADRNPVSASMQEILSVIDEAQISREAEKLEGFYASVRRRAAGIVDSQARQRLIVELYDKFFRGAFPRTTKMLGIVYTPVEIVDFIVRSVDEALKAEFGQTLSSKGVHILDPFTGTGTFVTRLLQSGLIAPSDLERKYRNEIHANEIVLLAYYIAAINIETTFHSLAASKDYVPFQGICLTDTFALHEGDDLLSDYMKDNSNRRERQKATEIRVIIGNPPYSTGQKSGNDNAQNVSYDGVDERIGATYAQRSVATLQRNLYDSYIRAIRWGSDRLGDAGVMAYVSGSAWIERAFADGMRKCLCEEFSRIHIFHLRGDIRKNMLSGGNAREGDNVFGQGSMTGVAVSIFVKNSKATEQGRIFFHDVGDDLSRMQKLEAIRNFGSIDGIDQAKGWKRIQPDRYGDWIGQRNESFEEFLKIGDKNDKLEPTLFADYSLGVSTNRDVWCINPSRAALENNIDATIGTYNKELARWVGAKGVREAPPKVSDFLNPDPKRISWSRQLRNELEAGKALDRGDGQFVPCIYRPFTKQWMFYSRRLNEVVSQMRRIFPNGELRNRVIAVTGKGGRAGFSALMLDALPNLHTIDSGQCFPFWLYEASDVNAERSVLVGANEDAGYDRHDGISEAGLQYFRSAYSGEMISREDLFYYVYGILHAKDYRRRFRYNLEKELPRIPCVKSVRDFRQVREAGRVLGELHVGFENAKPYPAVIDAGNQDLDCIADAVAFFRVEKMRHPGSGKTRDRSTVIYNRNITVRGIPEGAWNYVVNGKPALAWVMERQAVRRDEASGIVSDANRYAVETMGDPRYPLDLLLRVATVSVETMRVVRGLSKVQIT